MTHIFIKKTGIGLLAALALAACRPETPMVGLGIDETYAVERMKPLVLHPEYTGDAYVWSMGDSVLSTERDFVFCSADTGTYHLQLQIVDAHNPIQQNMLITVWAEQVAYSRYLSTVYEYRPAPGQFVNELPLYEDGDTEADMLQKVQNCISGTNNVLVSLGSYGGYITFGFDHSVVNIPNQYDFKILGNAFYAPTQQQPENGLGGSCEPGIVMVSQDRNQNGLPDDMWYELAGSEYYKPSTLHSYSITYQRPAPDHVPTPCPNTPMVDTTYIAWADSQGRNGYVIRTAYHPQDYFPKWLTDDQLSFSGTLLPSNAVDKSGNGSSWVLFAYDWGYADNHPNDSTDKNSFNIDWAVDANGNHVHLSCIEFVRVYTGQNQTCGWIGETSTELSKAEDLHILPSKNSAQKLKK